LKTIRNKHHGAGSKIKGMQRKIYILFLLGLSPESAFFGGMLYGFGIKRAKAAMTVVNDVDKI